MPDGRVARFEVPEGTTPEQAQAQMQAFIEQQPSPAAQPSPLEAPPQATPEQVSGALEFIGREQAISGEVPRLVQEARAAGGEQITPTEAALIGAGRGFTTLGRAVGLADPEMPGEREAFGRLEKQFPVATTVGEVAGESAPFLIPGLGVAGLTARTAQVAGSVGLGATEAGLIARGRGEDIEQQISTAGLGGAVAGALDLALPVIGRIGGALVRRVLGKEATGPVVDAAGKPTAELQQALDASGMSIDDINQEAQKILAQAPPSAAPEQAVRKAILEAEGLTPTKAQVTRNAADFQAQQEAAKTSGRVREALETQDAILTSRFNQAVLETGGQIETPTSTVTDALVGKATVLDDEVSRLYKSAREAAPGEKNVKAVRLVHQLRQSAGKNTASGGAIEAVVGELKSRGVLDPGGKLVGKIDVETAEEVRKLMNQLYDPQNSFRNGLLRELKDTLDDDVFSAAGKDVFDQGRSAKAAFEKELSRAKISKFDSRKANLVRDVLENKISPDSFTDDVVFSKKWRSEDLKQLKDYISTNPDGAKAFDDMRADTLSKIQAKAFVGPEDAAGNRALSRAALEAQFKKIGTAKMDVLFTKKERQFLKSMMNIAKLREPVRGTALGKGPSAQAIAQLEKKLADLPVIGNLVQFIDVDVQGRAALKGKPISLPRQVGQTEQALRGISGPAGAALITQEEQ